MRDAELITAAARAIRQSKYTKGVRGRRTDVPRKSDMRYAVAALPVILYALADVTATEGRLSSGALIQLAQSIEKAEDA